MKHWSPDTLLYLWHPFHRNNYFQQFGHLSATSYFLTLCLYYALLVQVQYIFLTSYLGGEDLSLTLCTHQPSQHSLQQDIKGYDTLQTNAQFSQRLCKYSELSSVRKMFTLPFLYLFFSIYLASVCPLLILYQTLSNRTKTQYEKPKIQTMDPVLFFFLLERSFRESSVLLSGPAVQLPSRNFHSPSSWESPSSSALDHLLLDHRLSTFLVYFLSSLAHPLVRFPKKTAWDRNFLRCFIAENILNLPSFLEVHTIIFFQNYEETVPVLAVERSANIWPWLGTIPTRTWHLYIIFSFFLEIFKGFTICLTLQDFMLCLKVGPFPSTVLGTQWSLNLEIQVFQFWEVFLSLFLSSFLTFLMFFFLGISFISVLGFLNWSSNFLPPWFFLFYSQGSFLTFSSKTPIEHFISFIIFKNNPKLFIWISLF